MRYPTDFEARGDIIRGPKQRYQWPLKKDWCPPKILKNKESCQIFYSRTNKSVVCFRQDSGSSTLVGRPLKIAALCGDQQDSEDTAGVPLYQHDVIVITAGTNFPLILSVHWVPLTASSVITSTQLQQADFSHMKAFLSLILMLKKFSYNE